MCYLNVDVRFTQKNPRRPVYPRQAVASGVPSAAPPRNPGNGAVALLTVLGSKIVAMLVTHSLTTHGPRGFGLVKVSREKANCFESCDGGFIV